MTQNTKSSNPMWGGRFSAAPAEIMEQLNASIDFDQRLYRQDIRGSIAHATMLADCAIITKDEAKQIIEALKEIELEIETGNFTFRADLEDIHMNIEARLREKIGAIAGKLHTARSRNDQVATDFRLWLRDAIDALIEDIKALQYAFLTQAQAHIDTIMPGFTHLQPAQPVTLGHHLLAYVEMFGRDAGRLANGRKRLNECPLGSAALAGTGFAIDREKTAQKLGFDCPTRNSLDAVSDRDFALEFLSAASICAMHLSRLGEELVLWGSPAFGFVTHDDAYSTGSSIMPQKKNPDAAELIRGKSGRIASQFERLLMVMKGLPLAYNKDTQEDKEPVFEAAEQLSLCLKVTTGMVETLRFHPQAMRDACKDGFLTATDFADWLVRECGVAFRDAHHMTAQAVEMAQKQEIELHELSLEDLQSILPAISEAVYEVLSVDASVRSRQSFGGTAPVRVKEAIEVAKKTIS